MADSLWKFGNSHSGCIENELDEQAIYTDMRHNTGYSFNLLVIQTLPYGQTAQIDLSRPYWVNKYPASVNLQSFYVSVSRKKRKSFQHIVYLQ